MNQISPDWISNFNMKRTAMYMNGMAVLFYEKGCCCMYQLKTEIDLTQNKTDPYVTTVNKSIDTRFRMILGSDHIGLHKKLRSKITLSNYMLSYKVYQSIMSDKLYTLTNGYLKQSIQKEVSKLVLEVLDQKQTPGYWEYAVDAMSAFTIQITVDENTNEPYVLVRPIVLKDYADGVNKMRFGEYNPNRMMQLIDVAVKIIYNEILDTVSTQYPSHDLVNISDEQDSTDIGTHRFAVHMTPVINNFMNDHSMHNHVTETLARSFVEYIERPLMIYIVDQLMSMGINSSLIETALKDMSLHAVYQYDPEKTRHFGAIKCSYMAVLPHILDTEEKPIQCSFNFTYGDIIDLVSSVSNPEAISKTRRKKISVALRGFIKNMLDMVISVAVSGNPKR